MQKNSFFDWYKLNAADLLATRLLANWKNKAKHKGDTND